MCINSRIAALQQQKLDLDAKIQKLENLQIATEPLMVTLSILCQDYRESAPEELPDFVERILAACQIKESALAIAKSASSGNEAAQEFAAVAIEQRATEAFKAEMQNLGDNYQRIAKMVVEHETEISPSVDHVQKSQKFCVGDRVSCPSLLFGLERRTLPGIVVLVKNSGAVQVDFGVGGINEFAPARLKDLFLENPPAAEVKLTTAEEVLKSKGFFVVSENFDADEKYETYRGWDVYYSLPNGGVVAINLCSEHGQLWDATTEYVQEIDETFPESLADFIEIVAWTRAVIDQVKNLEAPGQQILPLEFSDPTAEQIEEEMLGDGLTSEAYEQAVAEELALDDEGEAVAQEVEVDEKTKVSRRISEIFLTSLFGETVNIPSMEMLVTMWAQLRTNEGFSELAGVTFNFNSWPSGIRIFDTSQTRSEIFDFAAKLGIKVDDRNLPEQMAIALATKWKQQQEEQKSPPQSPEAKEESKFIEFVKLSDAVGYVKRRDNGEILSAYLGFSNKLPDGGKVKTMGKRRAKEWAAHLAGSFNIAADKIEVREPKRLTSENIKQPFAWEVKIVGLTIGKLQKLTEEDFSLLPNEIVAPIELKSGATTEDKQSDGTWSVTLNGYSLKSGSEEEVKMLFAQKCLALGIEGNVAIALWRGTETIESYILADFQFVPVEGSDEISPEFKVSWQNWSAKVWQTVKSQEIGEGGSSVERVWRHSALSGYTEQLSLPTKEAAAIHAVRRMQGLI